MPPTSQIAIVAHHNLLRRGLVDLLSDRPGLGQLVATALQAGAYGCVTTLTDDDLLSAVAMELGLLRDDDEDAEEEGPPRRRPPRIQLATPRSPLTGGGRFR